MYQGKRCKHKPVKRPLAILAALLALGLTIGGTIAYLTAKTDGVKNTFIPSKITTTVEENTSGGVKSSVKIKNTGDTTAWIRAAVVVTWQNDKGEVYGKAPQLGVDYTLSNLGANWIQGDDDFYYYTLPVEAGKSTGVLFEEIKPVEGRNPGGYFLNVEIIGSGIQYKPEAAFTAWAPNSGITWSESGLSK